MVNYFSFVNQGARRISKSRSPRRWPYTTFFHVAFVSWITFSELS